MNETAVNFEKLNNITIVPEFESVCPPLTDNEFMQLEQNILNDGEVTSPIVVWDNKLIDGHHRRQIILKNPEIPFQFKNMTFSNKYEAIAWICKNQAGRRNLTSEQLTYLIGKRYKAEKQLWGTTSDTFHGNQHTDVVSYQNDNSPQSEKTCERIAKEYGIGSATVNRAEKYSNGADIAEKACPGTRKDILNGSLKLTKNEVIGLSKLPVEQVPEKIAEYRKERKAQTEKRRKAQEEKYRQLDENPPEPPKSLSSISEISAYLAEPKRRNDIPNVIGIITDAALMMQMTCKKYIKEFPELLGNDKKLLIQALDELKKYLDEIYEEN